MIKNKKNKMSIGVRNTMFAMLFVIISMALIFNFTIPLAYSHDGYSTANVILWPIKQLSEYIVYSWIGINNSWGDSLSFFITEVPYIFLLLIIFSYLFNFARGFSTDAELSEWMMSKTGFSGRIIGSLMGFISPFCSCSTIPVVTSLVKSRTPFPTVMAFLITSPMINEVGVALLWSSFGYKVALLYMAFGFVIGILGSYVASIFKLENQIRIKIDDVKKSNTIVIAFKPTFQMRHRKAWFDSKGIFKKFWIILIFAMAIGSLMHGFIPTDWIKNNVGNKWWSPLVLIPIGLVLYMNVAATIPIISNFVSAGLGLGSALGFMMAVNTVSLPEMFILSKLFKKKFMVFYVTFILVAILIFSYILMVIPDWSLL